jgi:peptide deformylase
MKPLHITQRAPYGGLLSICSPVQDLKKEQPWIVQLVRIVIHDELEGLSANQAGINKQVFVTNVRGDGIRVYVNPILTIIDFDQIEYEEFCKSYPRTDVPRTRHSHIMIDYLNFSGEPDVIDTTDPKYARDVGLRLSARIQHEMEHMYGLSVREDPLDGEGLEELTSQPIRIMD